MHDRFLVLTTLLIAPLVAGCAQIKSFSVTPSIVCPGETVEIDWKASDKIALDAAPPLEGTGKGPRKARDLSLQRRIPGLRSRFQACSRALSASGMSR